MALAFTRPRSRSFALAAALLLPAAACDGPSEAGPSPSASAAVDGRDTSLPAGPPGIRGTITRVQPGADTLPSASAGAPSAPVSCPPDCGAGGTPLQSVLIEERPGQASGGDKSHVKVLRGARLLRRTAAGVVAIRFADLRVGQRVEAWFSGPVAESYPSQAMAAVIVVDER